MGTAAEVAAAVEACAPAPRARALPLRLGLPRARRGVQPAGHPAPCRAPTGSPSGWSDHTTGLTTALGAVALGAPVLEKHFTSDRSLPGPDHLPASSRTRSPTTSRSAEPLAGALGDGVKGGMPSEEENACSCAARGTPRAHLAAGTVLGRRRPRCCCVPRVASAPSSTSAGAPCSPSRRGRRARAPPTTSGAASSEPAVEPAPVPSPSSSAPAPTSARSAPVLEALADAPRRRPHRADRGPCSRRRPRRRPCRRPRRTPWRGRRAARRRR